MTGCTLPPNIPLLGSGVAFHQRNFGRPPISRAGIIPLPVPNGDGSCEGNVLAADERRRVLLDRAISRNEPSRLRRPQPLGRGQ